MELYRPGMEKKTFYQYMMTYQTWNTLRGDLSRDMVRELYLHPEEEVDKIDSEERYIRYLNVHRACQECINVAHRCWRAYRKKQESVC